MRCTKFSVKVFPRTRGANRSSSYVYSGFATQSTSMLGDFYVLSLPGFVWFRANYTSAVARAWTRCVALGDSQMIVVGGYTDPSPDPWSQGIGVFDLSSMSPRTSYDPKAGSYNTPGIVTDWYNNGYGFCHSSIAYADYAFRGVDSVRWSSETVQQLFLGQRKQNTTSMQLVFHSLSDTRRVANLYFGLNRFKYPPKLSPEETQYKGYCRQYIRRCRLSFYSGRRHLVVLL